MSGPRAPGAPTSTPPVSSHSGGAVHSGAVTSASPPRLGPRAMSATRAAASAERSHAMVSAGAPGPQAVVPAIAARSSSAAAASACPARPNRPDVDCRTTLAATGTAASARVRLTQPETRASNTKANAIGGFSAIRPSISGASACTSTST